jgi:THO complex subunit 7
MSLRGQIDQLKTSLEHAQVVRKRKIEYDAVAEKINALPTRDELNLYGFIASCSSYLTPL